MREVSAGKVNRDKLTVDELRDIIKKRLYPEFTGGDSKWIRVNLRK